jgi:hypothetical protein
MLEDERTECDLRYGILESRDIELEDITDEMLQKEKDFLYDSYFQDELDNLDVELDGRIVAIADLGLWNGRRQGYKVCNNNLKEILVAGNHDYIKVWGDGYNIRKTSIHHDGTNCYLFRELREDRNVDRFLEMIYAGKQITKSILAFYFYGKFDKYNYLFVKLLISTLCIHHYVLFFGFQKLCHHSRQGYSHPFALN